MEPQPAAPPAAPVNLVVDGGFESVATVDGLWEHVVYGRIGILLVVYAVFGVGVFALWGVVYRSRFAPKRSFLTGVGWGIAYFTYVYGFYITTWRAIGRIALGRHGWAKTRRNAEVGTLGLITLDH